MNKKTITLRWPPTKVQLAWGLAILYFLVANLILVPVGLMAEDNSGWQVLALIILSSEVVFSMVWIAIVIGDSRRGY